MPTVFVQVVLVVIGVLVIVDLSGGGVIVFKFGAVPGNLVTSCGTSDTPTSVLMLIIGGGVLLDCGG